MSDLADAETLERDSRLANFLFSRSSYRVGNANTKPSVKPQAFSGFTSAFHIDGLDNSEVADIANRFVAPNRPGSFRGWAELTAGDVLDCGLTLDRDNEPPRHVEVGGWPPDKPSKMGIEQRLAGCARPVLVP